VPLISAQSYGNEAAVGEGIKLSGVPRESIFLSAEINNMNHKRVSETMEESLQKLQTNYVDLLLMHWPVCIGMSLNPRTALICHAYLPVLV
jgi:diketogulonate reductase-like aldo/keto reductase